jgi:mono/diheme cytochrome c family protein
MRIFPSFCSLAGVVVLCGVLAGCRPLPPSKPAAQWTAQEARGAQVFQQKCARCHSPNTTHTVKGPGLQAISKQGGFLAGDLPSDQQITQWIRHGRMSMPATPLSDDPMRDLLAYLHTL